MFFEAGVPLAEDATTALPTTKEEIERIAEHVVDAVLDFKYFFGCGGAKWSWMVPRIDFLRSHVL